MTLWAKPADWKWLWEKRNVHVSLTLLTDEWAKLKLPYLGISSVIFPNIRTFWVGFLTYQKCINWSSAIPLSLGSLEGVIHESEDEIGKVWKSRPWATLALVQRILFSLCRELKAEGKCPKTSWQTASQVQFENEEYREKFFENWSTVRSLIGMIQITYQGWS